MSTLYPAGVAVAHDRMPADRVVAVSGRLILVSGMGSVVGPLVETGLMARFDIDGVSILMAAAAVLLTLVAASRSMTPHPRCTWNGRSGILAAQAAPLAHDPLGFSDETTSPDQVWIASDGR
jgi:hypothetical protein